MMAAIRLPRSYNVASATGLAAAPWRLAFSTTPEERWLASSSATPMRELGRSAAEFALPERSRRSHGRLLSVPRLGQVLEHVDAASSDRAEHACGGMPGDFGQGAETRSAQWHRALERFHSRTVASLLVRLLVEAHVIILPSPAERRFDDPHRQGIGDLEASREKTRGGAPDGSREAEMTAPSGARARCIRAVRYGVVRYHHWLVWLAPRHCHCRNGAPSAVEAPNTSAQLLLCAARRLKVSPPMGDLVRYHR